MYLDVDSKKGPVLSPRGVITPAIIVMKVPTKPMIEMRETRKSEFKEEDESVRRRVGHREEWMHRVITLHEGAELTLRIA